MGYADLAVVAAMLGVDAPDARMAALDTAYSLEFSRRVQRTFATYVPNTTRTIHGRGGKYLNLTQAVGFPVRIIASITVAGLVLPTSAYRMDLLTRNGEAWAIERVDGGTWPEGEPVTIAGQWGDTWPKVPEDVREAVNVLVAWTYTADKAGRGNTALGPGDLEDQARDPWTDGRVKGALAAWAPQPWGMPWRAG